MKFLRRLKAKKYGVPYFIKGFYVYTAWWSIEKEPEKWGWPDGVDFPNDFIRKLYRAKRGDIVPLATVGNLIHEYEYVAQHGVPGSDHLSGGSVEFDLRYYRTVKKADELEIAMGEK